MTPLVDIVLLVWIPVIGLLFSVLSPRRAVLAAFIAGMLFLPESGYRLQGLPDYTKTSATCAGILLATCVFDWARFRELRPVWADLPMVVWCLCPVASSLSNDLGLYDGLSFSLTQVVTWGFPYLLGRLYFRDLKEHKMLALAIVVGGLVYVPLCLWEIKVSPQLNRTLYGFTTQHWSMTKRLGGWRPMVFMQSGLAVGMWMCMSALVGVWVWRQGRVLRLAWLPLYAAVPALVVTAILCKSSGAIGLLLIGLVGLVLLRTWRSRWVLIALAAVSPAYVLARTTGDWSARSMVDLASAVSSEQAASLEVRLKMEDILKARAAQQPVFGWGGWGRKSPDAAEAGVRKVLSDGLWIIALGSFGATGLTALLALQLIPVILLAKRLAQFVGHPDAAASTVLAVVLSLSSIDNLLNAMLNPLHALIAGSLVGLYCTLRSRRAVQADTHGAARIRRLPWRGLGGIERGIQDRPTAETAYPYAVANRIPE